MPVSEITPEQKPVYEAALKQLAYYSETVALRKIDGMESLMAQLAKAYVAFRLPPQQASQDDLDELKRQMVEKAGRGPAMRAAHIVFDAVSRSLPSANQARQR